MPIRWQIFQIVPYAGFAHLDKHFLGRAGHAQIIGRALEPGGVLVRAEDGNPPVLLPESLKSFKAGNGIMKDLGEGVEGKGKVFRGLKGGPLPILISGENDGTGTVGVKAQGVPVDAVHSLSYTY